MIILHHLEHSRSMRIVWALQELQLDYELKYYRRLPNMSAPRELKRIHPLGKAPILQDEVKTIAESAVILDYLQQHYDSAQQFKPHADDAVIHYDYWMHYAEGSLMPLLVFSLVMDQLGGKKIPRVIRPLTKQFGKQIKKQFSEPRLKDHVTFIEQFLASHPYFAGEHFSFADIQMLFPIQGLLITEQDRSLPNIRAWVARVTAREGYQAAVQKSPDGGEIF